MSVTVRPATEKAGALEFSFDSPQPLFALPPMNGTLGTMAFRYAVTADGKRFLVLGDSGNATPAPITVLTNWQAGLKKLRQASGDGRPAGSPIMEMESSHAV
jgi:hypothetical protein